MWKARHNQDERRSHLFHDKPFVFGRWPKLLVAYGMSVMIWVGFYTRALQRQSM